MRDSVGVDVGDVVGDSDGVGDGGGIGDKVNNCLTAAVITMYYFVIMFLFW
jgi:hypothetical protein